MLAVSDIHQSALHYRSLVEAVAEHQPDVVAIVGDALYALGSLNQHQIPVAECAKILAGLAVDHLLFVRGNHEDDTWPEFVASWPHEKRPLTALYGTGCSIGPLTVVGFPCMTGSEYHWCFHLSADNNTVEYFPAKSRRPLRSDFNVWLPNLIRKTGQQGRVLWLMHEPPAGDPIAHSQVFNPIWRRAVERYCPQLVICGHDHETPIRTGSWHTQLGKTMCVNVGQGIFGLHYTVVDFEFSDPASQVPSKIKVRAYPWGQEIIL
jgi:Icc-related predicted phosphoesterase